MLSVGRCGVAKLQMTFGHMDGMHCIIDGTSVLVKIKSFALYNFWTMYSFNYTLTVTEITFMMKLTIE
jgi:hypothetical protein